MTIKDTEKIITGMTSEAALYWLDKAVRAGEITESEAGFILLDCEI